MLIHALLLYRYISIFTNYIKKLSTNVNIHDSDNKAGSPLISSSQEEDICDGYKAKSLLSLSFPSHLHSPCRGTGYIRHRLDAIFPIRQISSIPILEQPLNLPKRQLFILNLVHRPQILLYKQV
jgi:hypothetical protein